MKTGLLEQGQQAQQQHGQNILHGKQQEPSEVMKLGKQNDISLSPGSL